MASTKIRSSSQFYVDTDLAIGTHKITGVVDPTSAQDAATKAYVDSKVQGIDWQDSVLDKDILTPPGTPTEGDRYIINGTGLLGWAGHDYDIAEYLSAAWVFTDATEGTAIWVEDENVIYVWNGSAWVKMSGALSHANLLDLQGGTTSEYYHLTNAQHADLTDGGDTTLHTHTYLPLAGGTLTGDVTMTEDKHIGLTGALIHFNGGSSAIEVSNGLTVGTGITLTTGDITVAEDAHIGLANAYIHFNGGSTSVDISNKLSVTNQITSTLADGTMPFVLTSSTMSTNLNADLLDGQHGSYYATTSALANYLPLAGGTMSGDITMAEDGHIGLTNALIHFNSGSSTVEVNNALSVGTAATITNGLVVNEGGGDYDTRIEGDTDANLLFIDAGNNRVGIRTATPGYELDVNGKVGISTDDTAITATIVGSATISTPTGVYIDASGAAVAGMGTKTVGLDVYVSTSSNLSYSGKSYGIYAEVEVTQGSTSSAAYGGYFESYGGYANCTNYGIWAGAAGGLNSYAGYFAGAVYTTGQLTSSLAIGTAPLAVTSTTVNTNLNADLLDGYHSSSFFQTTGAIIREVPAGLKNGSNVTYTLAYTPVSGTDQLFLNGILQNAGSGNDYTISTNTVTMAAAPASTDVLLCTYWK